MPLALGIAFGARSTTVEIRDADHGDLVARGRAVAPRHAPDDPTTWWRTTAAAVADAGARRVDAVSVAGSHPGLVLLDRAGAVGRPLVRWDGVNTSPDVAALRQALGPERWATVVGGLPSAGTAVTRVTWLLRHHPRAFDRLGGVLLPHDWLSYRLSGRRATDRASASITGCWSPRDEAWVDEVLALLDQRHSAAAWHRRLPTVLGPSEPADWLHAPATDVVALTGRPLVGPGTGEAMAVGLALGAGPGHAVVAHGTTTTVLVGLAAPIADPSGRVRSRADATGGHVAIASAGGGTALTDAVARLLGVPAGELGRLIAAEGPGPVAERPVLVPGNGQADATLTALGAGTTRGGLAAAALDGIACTALDLLDAALSSGADAGGGPLVLVAPAATAADHASHLAALAGRPVAIAPLAAPAATGACVQAAAVLDGTDPTEVRRRWDLDHGAVVVDPPPRPDRHEQRQRHADERARLRAARVAPD